MMEQWKKILIIGITLFVLFFLCLHMFVNVRGKDLLSQKLEEAFHRKVKIGSLSTSFPANIYIKNIEVEGLFKINEVVAGRGMVDIFSRDFNLSRLKVIKPVVTLEKLPERPPGEPTPAIAPSLPQSIEAAPAEKSEEKSEEKPEEKPVPPPDANPLGILKSLPVTKFSIGRLIVSDGTVNFTDRSMLSKELTIKAEHVNLRVDNLSFGGRGVQITSFDLKGSIPWRESVEKGKIEAEGWIDFGKKDMQATIKISDIDGVYLYPYYSTWVDLEKIRIVKANLNFNSNIHGLNNNVTAECHIELSDIVRKERPPEEPEEREERIASAVIDMFKTLDQGRIVLDFTIRTKMDRPEFGFGNIKMAVKDKLAQARSSVLKGPQEVFLLPVKLVEGVVKGATDISKAMIDGTFAVGKEIAQSFKKQPK